MISEPLRPQGTEKILLAFWNYLQKLRAFFQKPFFEFFVSSLVEKVTKSVFELQKFFL